MIYTWFSGLSAGWWQWILAGLPGVLFFYLTAELVYHAGRTIPVVWRYVILLLILVKCVLPTPWTLSLPVLHQPKADLSRYLVNLPIQQEAAQTIPARTTPKTEFSDRTPESWPPLHQTLFAVNLAGSVILLLWIGIRMGKFHRRLRCSSQHENLRCLAAPLCVRMNMHLPRIYADPHINGSLTGGWWRPYIVVPERLLKKNPAYQQAVLSHELGHIQRGDVYINAIQIFLTVLCWWNPIIARLNFLIRCEREHCCDDLVLRLLEIEPETYSSILLDSAEEQVRFHERGWGLAFAYPRHAIFQRIRRMVMQEKIRRKAGWLGASLSVCLTVSLLFGFQIAGAQSEKSKNLVELMKVLQQLQLQVMNAYANDVVLQDQDLSRFIQISQELGDFLTQNIQGVQISGDPLWEAKVNALQKGFMDAYRKGDKVQMDQLGKELYDLVHTKELTQPTYRLDDMTNTILKADLARVKSEQSALKNALKSFFIDNNTYPVPLKGNRIDQAGIKTKIGDKEIILRLTTPVAYISLLPKDPFDPEDGSYRYFSDGNTFYCLSSVGPDLKEDFDVTTYKGRETNLRGFSFDPVNGITSPGDIITYGP